MGACEPRPSRVTPSKSGNNGILGLLLLAIGCGEAGRPPFPMMKPPVSASTTSDTLVAATPGPSVIGPAGWGKAIAVSDAGVIHATWREGSPALYLMVYARSVDGGATWSPAILGTCIPQAGTQATLAFAGPFPRLAAAAGHVYVSWYCAERLATPFLVLRRSTDEGASWLAPQLLQVLSFTGTGCDCDVFNFNPAVAAVGPDVHVVWSDEIQFPGLPRAYSKILLRSSHDFGATWQDIRLVSSPGPFDSWVAAIAAAADGLVHVVWVDMRNGAEMEYYRRSFDGGASFTEPEQQLTFAPNSWAPSLALSGRFVHLAYIDNRDHPTNGSFRVYYRRSADLGAPGSWDEPEQNPADAVTPTQFPGRVSLAASGSRVRLAWHGVGASGAGPDVYYFRSDADGEPGSWSQPIPIATIRDHGTNPSVAMSAVDGCAHVTWEDTRSGAQQIFYRGEPSSDGP